MPKCLYVCIWNIKGAVLTGDKKKKGLLHISLRKADPKS